MIKKLLLCIVLSIATSVASTDEKSNDYFLPYETETYHYTVSKIEKPKDNNASLRFPVTLWEKKNQNLYNTGFVRSTIKVSTINDRIIITIEKWKTKNESYRNFYNLYLLLSPTLLFHTENKILSQSAFIALITLHGLANLSRYSLKNEVEDRAQSILDTITIEKATLDTIAKQNHLINAEKLNNLIEHNQNNWKNIPAFLITYKLSQDEKEVYSFDIQD
jgi:uncharacterized membrane protein